MPLANILTNISKINICSVLYTTKGIKNIKDSISSLANKDVEVVVLSGRNIDSSAFFGDTEHIGELDKLQIINSLTNSDFVDELYDHLDVKASLASDYKKSTIGKINLIARYQSLPKLCFKFLQFDLRNDPNGAPFKRFKESYES